MPKKFRLKLVWLIQKILRKGQKISGPFLIGRYLPSRIEHSQFCLIVSTKVSKSAVKRNKIKRRLREILRHNMTLLTEPYNIIFIARVEVLRKSFQELEQEVVRMLTQISKLKCQN